MSLLPILTQALQVSLSQEEAEISVARRNNLMTSVKVVAQAFSSQRTHLHRFLIAWLAEISE